MECHEQGAERDSEEARQYRPPQREAKEWANEANRDREELEVAEEPQHRLLPGPAVPFGVGNPVDGVHFDLAEQRALDLLDRGIGLGACRHIASWYTDSRTWPSASADCPDSDRWFHECQHLFPAPICCPIDGVAADMGLK